VPRARRHLACIETEAEADFLREKWPEGGDWLGGVLGDNDEWRWINGQPWSHAPWADGQPALSGGEMRLMAGQAGRWRAVGPSEEKITGYLCEWEK
jgi:hypothetical protein